MNFLGPDISRMWKTAAFRKQPHTHLEQPLLPIPPHMSLQRNSVASLAATSPNQLFGLDTAQIGLFLSQQDPGYIEAFKLKLNEIQAFYKEFKDVRKEVWYLRENTPDNNSIVVLYIAQETTEPHKFKLQEVSAKNLRDYLGAHQLVVGIEGQQDTFIEDGTMINGVFIPNRLLVKVPSVSLVLNLQAETSDATFQPKSLFFETGGRYSIWAGYSINQCHSLRLVSQMNVDVS
jgi:hypothetical protein